MKQLLLKLLIVHVIYPVNGCTENKRVEEKEKPNIIWIFSDDHSYQTIGAYKVQD